MNHCKEALKTAGLVFRTEYGQNTWREKEANTPTFHRGTGSVEYSDYDGDARRDQLDLILDQFIQSDSTEDWLLDGIQETRERGVAKGVPR